MRIAGLAAAVTLMLATPAVAAQDRQDDRSSIVARSKVWLPSDIPSKNLLAGPQGPGAFAPGETVHCEYRKKNLRGRSPKFSCVTADGDELKVKFGGTNGEVYAEVAASRLLWALGFGADRMYSVRVICRGCPIEVGGILRANGRERILDPAAVERKLAREIHDEWSWGELDNIREEAGGATRAERDALKLLAVMLQHGDSKPEQQRIVCLDEPYTKGRCQQPLMMVNDLGLTFGRANRFNQQPAGSMNLAEWRRVPVFAGHSGCVGNIQQSFTGTLHRPVISEEGRAFLADLLLQLSDAQLRQMFHAARVGLRPREPGSGRSGFPSVDEWVDAFKAKRTEIVERRC